MSSVGVLHSKFLECVFKPYASKESGDYLAYVDNFTLEA